MTTKLYDLLTRLTLIVGMSTAGSICDVPRASAQIPDQETSEASGGDSTRALRAEIAQAIENLGSNRFRLRQAAIRLLVAGGKDAIDALEQGANADNLETSSRCVEALAQIAQGKNDAEVALAALRRLSANQSSRVSDLASNKVKILTMTDEDRAVEALARAGARIHRGRNDHVFSVTVARDREVAQLQHLPTLHSATLIGVGITDAGLKSLVNARQLADLTLMRTSVTSAGFRTLTEMKSLDNLMIHEMQVTTVGMRNLAKIGGLRSLSFYELSDSEVLECLPEIRQIDSLRLSYPKMTSDFAGVFNQCSHLTELDLTVKELQDRDCQQLAEIKLPLDLRISRSTDITEEGWKALGQARLVDLSLYKTSIDDASLTYLALLKGLTRLSITDARITDEGLKQLEGLKDLRYVTFRDTDVTEEGAARLREALPNARRVTVSKGAAAGRFAARPKRPVINFTDDRLSGGRNAHLGAVLTDEIVEKLKKETDLSTVFLLRDESTDEHLKMLKGVPLKGIFVKSDKVTGDGIRSLRHRVDLKSIYVSSEAVGDDCVETLTRLPSLSKLQLIGVRFTDDGVHSLIEGLAANRKFTWLNLSECPGVTDASLKEIGSLKSLRLLSLRDNPGITSKVLEQVGKLDGLTNFSFDGAVIDHTHLEQISDLALTRLSLNNSQFTEKSVETIASSFPNLEHLHLSGSDVSDSDIESISKLKKLKWLSLAKTSVGDEGMAGLNELTELQFLYLSDTAVSDEGLAKLNRLTKLKYIHIDSTLLTQTGIERFQETHPDTKVR